MRDAHDPAILDRLIAAQFALRLWETEAREFLDAARGARHGFVDGQHLSRSSELIELIQAELAALQKMALTTKVPLTKDAIEGLSSELSALVTQVKQVAAELQSVLVGGARGR